VVVLAGLAKGEQDQQPATLNREEDLIEPRLPLLLLLLLMKAQKAQVVKRDPRQQQEQEQGLAPLQRLLLPLLILEKDNRKVVTR
jgi:hypothetical protein